MDYIITCNVSPGIRDEVEKTALFMGLTVFEDRGADGSDFRIRGPKPLILALQRYLEEFD